MSRPARYFYLRWFWHCLREMEMRLQKQRCRYFGIIDYPAMTVRANGAAVGLSWGEMGNSEVGHLTIGAGILSSLPRINPRLNQANFPTVCL